MWGEPETCASTLDRRYNFVDVVADDAKPDVLGILLYHTAQSCLGCGCHHVCFVEDDEFEARRIQCPRLRKVLDLFADHVDPTVI